MLRVLLVGILLSTPLLADHLIGSWNNYDPDEGDIYLRLSGDGTFQLTAMPTRALSDALVDSALQAISFYRLKELIDSGMRPVVINHVSVKGTFTERGDMIDLHHPEGAEYNIDGHIFNTWEFYAFLAASILATDDLEISAGGKESLIFLADTYMVDVVLAEDLLITTLRYNLSDGLLTVHGLLAQEKMVLRGHGRGVVVEETAVETKTWGDVKSSLSPRRD